MKGSVRVINIVPNTVDLEEIHIVEVNVEYEDNIYYIFVT